MFDYPRCKNKNRSRSIDGHLKGIVAMSSLAVLALKVANTLIMCHSDIVFVLIIRLTSPTIIDGSLTRISRMGQR